MSFFPQAHLSEIQREHEQMKGVEVKVSQTIEYGIPISFTMKYISWEEALRFIFDELSGDIVALERKDDKFIFSTDDGRVYTLKRK